LATINTVDFFYTCDSHLTDRGFASLVEPPSPYELPKPEGRKVSDEEIKKIKEEWEEKQRKKKEKEKENSEKEKEKEKDAEKDASKAATTKSPPPPAPIPVPGSAAPAKPAHQKYILHRDVWAMRLGEHKKKRQTAAAKEVAPRLPGAPRGMPL